ncbi:MAG TPA: hypothetical protein VKY25_00050, partial [Erysipelothrix sp.]|nr:hypothetical protein [Erysipelothrix sp.]
MEEMKWLWGKIGEDKPRYFFALILSIVVSTATIVVPHVSRLIVDTYITGPNSVQNLQNDKRGLILLILFVIIFTLFRTGLAYFTMMMFEHVS